MKTSTLWACLLLVSVSFANTTHKVRQGENDHTIARKLGVSVRELHQANPGVRWERLQIGQSLRVPGRGNSRNSNTRSANRGTSTPQANATHTVRSGDSDWSIARQYGLTVSQLHAMNPNVDFHPLQLGTTVRVRRAPATTAQTRATSRPATQPRQAQAPRPVTPPAQPASAPAVASATAAAAPKPVQTGITTVNAEVKGNDVALRAAPSTTAGRIVELDRGVVGRVVDRQGDWFRLMFTGGATGWVHSKFLQNTAKGTTPLPTQRVAQSPRTPQRSAGSVQSSAGRSLINTAMSLQGIRYRWGGTSRNGFDCSGFVQYVFRQHGVRLPRTSREQARVGQSVSRGSLRAGDLVFFITRGRSISHVGIYIGNNRFVHASSGGNRIRVNELTGYYANRYAGARRVSSRFTMDTVQDELDKYASTLPVEELPADIDPEPDPVIASSRGTDTVSP